MRASVQWFREAHRITRFRSHGLTCYPTFKGQFAVTIQIELSPELEAKLRELATAARKDPVTFAREAVEEKLRGPRTFAEILAPIHREVEESHARKEELDQLFQEAIDDSRRNRKA
jgi:predicted transcriptional regulator